MAGLNRFAVRFHFRAQIYSKEQHQALSEILILSLAMCQTAMDMLGTDILIPDNKGKPRKARVWLRALRTMMDDPQQAVRISDAIDVFEKNPLPESFMVYFTIGSYPSDPQAAFIRLVQHGIAMGIHALEMIGGTCEVEHNGQKYSPETFANEILSGRITIEAPKF